MEKIKIAVDAMGGDLAPAAVVEGAVGAVKEDPDILVLLCGQEEAVRAELAKFRETWRLVVSPLDHPEQRTYLTSLYEAAYAPAWSPDGKLIAYTGFRDGDAGWGVYVMPSEGVVTQRIADGRNPSFTPDGKSIIYDRDGTIYRREVTR